VTFEVPPADINSDTTVEHLRALRPRPRYLAIVAHWQECGEPFVRQVHRLTRRIDPTHPFGDVAWGVITGHDEDSARTMAAVEAPLAIRRVVSGSVEGVDLRAFHSGVAVNELVQHHGKQKGGPRTGTGDDAEGGEDWEVPADATMLLKREIEDPRTDLIVTSGHARETEWNIGFGFPGGQFRPGDDGTMRAFGVGSATGPDAILPGEGGATLLPVDPVDGVPITANGRPRVYSAAGNCLMGHVNSEHCMALAWFRSCGVRQMVGYTVPTWFGFAGWGVHRYLFGNVGALTFAESYFANQQALQLRLLQVESSLRVSGDAAGSRDSRLEAEQEGLAFDSDATVLFGDPAWEARIVPPETDSGGAYYDIALSESESESGLVEVVVRVTTLRAGCWTPACADDKTTLPGRPPFIYRKPSTLDAPWPCASYINPAVSGGMIITAMFVMVPLEGGFDAGEVITRTAVVGRGPQGTLPGLQCESQPAAAAPAASASSTTNSSAISAQ
jgi:zinc protease